MNLFCIVWVYLNYMLGQRHIIFDLSVLGWSQKAHFFPPIGFTRVFSIIQNLNDIIIAFLEKVLKSKLKVSQNVKVLWHMH